MAPHGPGRLQLPKPTSGWGHKKRASDRSESFAGHLTSNRLPALPSGIGRERRGTRTPYRRWWIGREPLASYATETRPKPRLQAGLFLWPFLLLPSDTRLSGASRD